MNTTVPYPLNPNLSCVERVRKVFCELIKRRMIYTARIRPSDFNAIQTWVLDVQANTLPISLINEHTLKEEWRSISNNVAVREFLYGLCFEMRMRCFEEKEDFAAYLESIAFSISQFNDQLSVIPDEVLKQIGDYQSVLDLLSGNVWVLPIILLEQLDSTEIGLEIALSAMETANERAASE